MKLSFDTNRYYRIDHFSATVEDELWYQSLPDEDKKRIRRLLKARMYCSDCGNRDTIEL